MDPHRMGEERNVVKAYYIISILPCFYKQLNWQVGLLVAAMSQDPSNWATVEDSSQVSESGSS